MSPYFAKYKMSDVMYGSVGSTHFNHGLECANQGVPCAIPEISEDGKLSASKLASGSPKFAKALADGLTWTVIRWEVEVMFPGLPSLLQSALNASGQIQDGDLKRGVPMGSLALRVGFGGRFPCVGTVPKRLGPIFVGIFWGRNLLADFCWPIFVGRFSGPNCLASFRWPIFFCRIVWQIVG